MKCRAGCSGIYNIIYVAVAQCLMKQLTWNLSDYYKYYKSSESLINCKKLRLTNCNKSLNCYKTGNVTISSPLFDLYVFLL